MTIKNAADNTLVEKILSVLAGMEPVIGQLLNIQPPLKIEAHNAVNDVMNYTRDAAKEIAALEESSEYLPHIKGILGTALSHLSKDSTRLYQMLEGHNSKDELDVYNGGLMDKPQTGPGAAHLTDKLFNIPTGPTSTTEHIIALVKSLVSSIVWLEGAMRYLPDTAGHKQLAPEKPTALKQSSEEQEADIKTATGNHMRVSDLLTAMATWLESPENEAILLAEDNEECLEAVATACLAAAEILKGAAAEAEILEPAEPSKLTPEALDHLQLVMTAFDTSGDADLQKTASVIDELLLTIATPDWAKTFKESKDNRLDTLERLYKDPKKELDALYKTKESAEKIDQSKIFEPHTFRSQQFALQSRSCPDHPGAGLARIGTDEWQCQMDKKVYNWRTGFTLETGEKVLGGEVQNQTPNYYPNPHSLFDSRETRLFGYTAGPKK